MILIWLAENIVRRERGKTVVHQLNRTIDNLAYRTISKWRSTIELIEGKAANLAAIPDLTREEYSQCCEITGIEKPKNTANITKIKNRLTKALRNTCDFVLKLETEIIRSDNIVITVRDFIEMDSDKLPIFSPIRNENNPSAFIAKNEEGVPFVYDSALDTSIFLNQSGQLKYGLINTADFSIPVPFHEFKDYTGDEDSYTIKGTIENFKAILDHYGINVRQDLIKKERSIVIPKMLFTPDTEHEAKLAQITSLCERNKFPSAKAQSYITCLADQKPYNPVLEWAESKKWDGTDRMDALFNCLQFDNSVSDTDKQFLKNLFVKWFIGAIATGISTKGEIQDLVLVFVGGQGIGKTRFFNTLCPHQHLILDGATLNPSDKDSVKSVISHWLVELGELDATFRKADIAQLKSFLSNEKDNIRLPYDKTESVFPRRTAFMASVNCYFPN